MSERYASDAGLYDPNLHDNQIVAVYETRSRAEAVRDELISAGIPRSAINIVAETGNDAQARYAPAGTTARDEPEGFWGAMKNLFAPEDDYNAYQHAVGRGHAMVVVTSSAGMDRQRVIQMLEQSDPVDFEATRQDWSTAGTAARGETNANAPLELGRTTGTTAPRTEPTGARPPAVGMQSQPSTSGLTAGNSDKIDVVEERLRIGKREVAQGAVRVRSYVVERPVEEQVTLHSERVAVERHPVDRPVDEADTGLFKERTIEARAMGEEAVVRKEARVVEEIGLRKEAADRTETVKDTVRETKVEVDDQTARAEGRPAKTAQRQR